MPQPRAWWHPDKHSDRRPFLLSRQEIKRHVRRWFEDQGFTEVDTTALQISPGNETHLHAFATSFRAESGRTEPFYLHTSPEFAMKKLLAAGERKIFTFAPVYRNAERGPLHSPEFTMLEWYRAGERYETLMDDCRAILGIAASVTGRQTWTWRGTACDLGKPAEALTVHEAFRRFADVELDRTLSGPTGEPDHAAMAQEAARIGIRVAPDDTWSDLFSRILAERIEPRLGSPTAQFLCEYPTHEAALARASARDPRVAERFELYVCGVELANAFGELTDPTEQRRRFEIEMAEKARIYGERYPVDEDFLAALAMMPEASGSALGFDRLVVLATGATQIDQVLWTPVAGGAEQR